MGLWLVCGGVRIQGKHNWKEATLRRGPDALVRMILTDEARMTSALASRRVVQPHRWSDLGVCWRTALANSGEAHTVYMMDLFSAFKL